MTCDVSPRVPIILKILSRLGLPWCEITVGEVTLLESAIKESINNYENVVLAQATVDGVTVERYKFCSDEAGFSDEELLLFLIPAQSDCELLRDDTADK